MSLVALKNFFWRTPRAEAKPARCTLQRQDSSGRQSSEFSTATLTDADLEAQQRIPLLGNDGRAFPEPEGFRIDARVISDATIGLSDGLTVPFALTAGLSALGDPKIVIYGSLAELIAGAISMGLGGYLGAKSEL